MTKARQEAQEQLRQQMQEQVTNHLQKENGFLVDASIANAEGRYPDDTLAYNKARLNGLISAYRKLGFRTDVFS